MVDFPINGPVAPANLPLDAQQKMAAPHPMHHAIRQAHGQGGHKKASQIIQDYVMAQTGNQQQVAQVMGMLDALTKRKLSRLIQFGNTVFWATQAGRGVMDVHIFSEEAPHVMARRIQQGVEWAKQHGFQRITSTLTDNQQIGVIKASGVSYTVKPTQVNDGQKMVPAQIITIEVR